MDAPLSASAGQTEERLRLALDAAGLGWWQVDLVTGAMEWSDRFEELTGLSRDRPIDYQAALQYVHPEDLARVDAAVQAATRAQDPRPYSMDFRMRLPGGGYRWVHSRGQTYSEGEGAERRPTRFVGTLADVDDRIRAEGHHRQLLDSVDAGFCVIRVLFDEDGSPSDYRFIQVNPAFQRQTGLVDAVGKTARELVPGLESHWFELYGAVATTGEPNRFTQGSDAMERVFDVHAFRLGDPDRREVGILFTDVTMQKAMERTLREANARNAAILESITDGFYSLDREWRFTYVNREAERLLGRSDLVGKGLWEEYPGFEEAPFGRAYLRIAAGGPPESLTEFYPQHDRWYEVHANPAAEGITVYFRDAGERVRHEQERELLLRQVEEERNRLMQSYETSPAFVAILRGEDLVFDYANAPYFALVGHREILGKPLIEALPEIADQDFPVILRNVMVTGEPFEIDEMPVVLRRTPEAKEEERFVSLRYLPMRGSDGTISGVYAHGIDITEAVRAKRTLAKRAEETAQGSRRKDEFLATLAHELRNPLAPIRLSTELMAFLEPTDPEFDEARMVIQRQVDHMVRLVDDLLDVSRVAQGKIKLRYETVDLARAVTAAIETSRPGMEANGHTFEVALPSEPIFVRGDVTRLAQVVANLLNNAAKYTPRGGRIELRADRDGGEVVLRVRDNGVGVPPEMLPHIFDMFAQAKVHMVQAQGGLGIGLTLCRRLVEMHGGTITARSEGSGSGSEFIVRLPIASGAVPPVTKPPASNLDADAARVARRVLVVDDNGDNAWTLSGLLENMGHEVRVANTGQEALAAAEIFRPEVVLLDLGLPDLPGYEIARRLRAHPGSARAVIVAQTGWGREEDRALAREAGFDAHLVKPLARADLDRLFGGLASDFVSTIAEIPDTPLVS